MTDHEFWCDRCEKFVLMPLGPVASCGHNLLEGGRFAVPREPKKGVDFGLVAAGDEVHCAVCGERFQDGQKVYHVGDGSWNEEGPNWEGTEDWAFVHAHCVEPGVR